MWNINYESQAVKFLEKADKVLKIKIAKYLHKVSANPTKYGKSLSGGLRGIWRYRVEDYRILCKFEEKELIILVIDIGHRSKIYKSK